MGAAAAIAVPALIGAIGSRKQAQAANRPREYLTDQTSTQSPYGGAQSLLDSLIPAIQGNFDAGPARLPSFRGGGGRASKGVLDQLQNFSTSNRGSLDSLVQGIIGNQGGNELSRALSDRILGQNTDRSGNLIESFLGTGVLGNGGYPLGQGAPGQAGGQAAAPRNAVSYVGGGGGGGGFGGGGGGGLVPDTLARGGTVADAVRGFLDPSRLDPANDPTVQPLLDMLNRNAEEGFSRLLAPLESRVEGLGRLGSDFHQGLVGQASEQAGQALADAQAKTLFQSRQSALDAALQALGIGNTRDVAAGQIGAQDRASSRAASSAASARASSEALARDQLALQRFLGTRGQDLSAILGLQGSEDSRLGILGNLSGNLDSARLGAGQLGLGLGNLDLNALLGAGDVAGGIDQRGLDASALRYQSDLNRANAGNANLDDFLRRTLAIAGLGGTSTTSGTNVVPGAGVSPTGAGLLGLLGGATTGAGLAGAFGSKGGG